MEREKKIMYFKVIIFTVLISIIIVLIMTFSKIEMKDVSYELKTVVFGEDVKQTVYSNNGESITIQTSEKLKLLDSLTSCYDSSSEIFKINSSGSKLWTDISDEVMDILLKCMEVSEKSNGFFDPTIKPLVSLWGFDSGGVSLPDDTKIKETLKSVGYRNLKVNKSVKRAKLFNDNSAITLDLVLKGAACNYALEEYKKLNAQAAIISVGRTIGVYGKKSKDKPWNIAIRNPFDNQDNTAKLGVLKVSSESVVSTLSQFDKCFESDGKTYMGILDVRTGYPIETDLVSVTILHEDGIISDALSIACYLLGCEKSLDLLNYYGANAIFVNRDKKIFLSKNIKNIFTLIDKSCTVEQI